MADKLDSRDVTLLKMIGQGRPSLQEMAAGVGRSKTATRVRLLGLEKNGYIMHKFGAERAYGLTDKGQAVFPELVLTTIDIRGQLSLLDGKDRTKKGEESATELHRLIDA